MTLHLLWLIALNLLGFVLAIRALPLLLELAILSAAAIVPPRAIPQRRSDTRRLAVIVPAHNEEALIAACVTSLLTRPGVPVEVFVIAHNCTDRTAERAAEAGARVLPLTGPGGKGLALDHGFRHALSLGADALLVIDADSIVSPNLLATVADAIRAGAEAVQVRYQAASSSSLRTELAALALLGMNVVRPRGRSRLGLSCGIFGNGFALSAATLARVPFLANSLVEDREYHLRLLRAGIRVDFLDSATVFGELPEKSAAAASQRTRWEGGRTLMRREWSRRLARAVFRGELRLLEPLLDLLAVPLATGALLSVLTACIPLLWTRIFGLAGLASAAGYVAVSSALSPDPGRAWKALLSAPGYLLWKLSLAPRIRRDGRKDAAWIRTGRNAEATPDVAAADKHRSR